MMCVTNWKSFDRNRKTVRQEDIVVHETPAKNWLLTHKAVFIERSHNPYDRITRKLLRFVSE